MPLVNIDLPASLGGLFSHPQSPVSTPPAHPDGVWMLMPIQARLGGTASAPQLAPTAPPPATTPSAPATTSNVPPSGATTRLFTRHGPSRAIQIGDRRILVRDRKGHRYLQCLITRPFQSIAAVTLKAAEDGCDPSVFSGSKGTTLSQDSVDELRERYRDLIGELEEARVQGSTLRQETIARELERIASECQRATRPGQRLREHTDAEKVRISVTNAIRRGIWGIKQASPEIADYFQRTIVTGHWLMYRPLTDEVWQV